MLTKEQLAERLNGRQYGDEVDRSEIERFKEDGLVIVYGASDDLIEFRGVIDEELDCYNGGTFFVSADGAVIPDKHQCECKYCGYEKIRESSVLLEAVWCDEKLGCSWSYKTEIPHATFDIFDDGELYCRGIVFSLAELKGCIC